MTEPELLSFLAVFAGGIIIGILATLAFNKVRSGKASAGAVKREYDDYQSKVEEHFDETSEKFKAMAEQYKDLYQHLSVGATSLCRPEHVVAGLSDQADPLQLLPKPEKKSAAKSASHPESKSQSISGKQAEAKSQKPEQAQNSNTDSVKSKDERNDGVKATAVSNGSKAGADKPTNQPKGDLKSAKNSATSSPTKNATYSSAKSEAKKPIDKSSMGNAKKS